MKTNRLVLRLMKHFFSSVMLLSMFQNLYGQVPAITGVTPTSGPVGTTVTITGTNFNTTLANNIAIFGTTRATVTSATATQLKVTVPAGAIHSPITAVNTATGLSASSSSYFLPTFTPNKGSIATSDFSAAVGVATGDYPISNTISDVDGDGKPDLAVVNQFANTVSVLRNTSTVGVIAYAPKIDFNTGSSPISIATGDLDGDGKPEMVVANSTSYTVSVFRNTSSAGAVSYAAKIDFTTANEFALAVAISDLDGDGKPDLAVATLGNKISVLKNTSTVGAISFAEKDDFTVGSGHDAIAMGDLDGDDKPDIVVTNSFPGNISVLRNTSAIGTISFAPGVNFTTTSQPKDVSISDLDRDGKLDLAVPSFATTGTSILRNISTTGNINFASKVDIQTNTNSFSVAIGDLDGDGKADLAVEDLGFGKVFIYENISTSGTIGFAEKVEVPAGGTPNSISIGDVDGDGKPDLVMSFASADIVGVVRNNPVIAGAPTITSFTPTSGTVGTSVTITGTNFSATPANNKVTFNGTTATVSASTTTSISTTVPAGATTGKIEVTVAGVKATSSESFTVTTCTNPAKPTITHTSSSEFTSSTLTSSDAPVGGTYQWLHNGMAISGATSKSYVTSDIGSYSVRITVPGGCNATSDPFDLVITDTEQSTLARDIVLYPNPASDWLTLSLGNSEGQKDIIIYLATGKAFTTHRTVGKETSVYVADYPVGMYIVKVCTSRSIGLLRFIKQ